MQCCVQDSEAYLVLIFNDGLFTNIDVNALVGAFPLEVRPAVGTAEALTSCRCSSLTCILLSAADLLS